MKIKDKYPWLDEEDPRRKMTDEEILRLKVPLDKSILTAVEKRETYKTNARKYTGIQY